MCRCCCSRSALPLHLQIKRVDSASYARFLWDRKPSTSSIALVLSARVVCLPLSACLSSQLALQLRGSARCTEVPGPGDRPHRPQPRPSTQLTALPVSGGHCARWTSRNALCAFQDIVRRIKGFAATVLLSFGWLWPSTACHWLWSLPFAPRGLPVIIVVSEAQLDDRGLSSLPNVGIGGLTYLDLTVGSIRWHWSCLVAGRRVCCPASRGSHFFWIILVLQFDYRLLSSYSAIASSCTYK